MRAYRFPRLFAVLLVLMAGIGAPAASADRSAQLALRPTAPRPSVAAAAQTFGEPFLVEDLTISGHPRGLGAHGLVTFNDAIYFVGGTPGTSDELWRTGGSITNTAMVTELYPGSQAGVYSPNSGYWDRVLVPYAGKLYFAGVTAHHGTELWATAGTLTGTVLVRDIATGTQRSEPELLIPYGGQLFFTADDYVHGQELWKTDGTYTGTVMVKDINAGSGSSTIDELVAYNGRLWFGARTSSQGEELWSSDGTLTGTTQFISLVAGFGDSAPEALTPGGGLLYFTAHTAAAGRELWRTDGTVPGTFLLKDIYTGTAPSSIYDSPVAANGNLFFSAQDPDYGGEVWRSDGTVTGTVRVADINPGPSGSGPTYLTPYDDAVYFWADDGVNDIQLWRTTLTTTEMVPGTPLFDMNGTSGMFAHSTGLYFAAADVTYGTELWRYDGSTFTRLTDLNPGAANSNPGAWFSLDAEHILFSANDGATGDELYRLHTPTGQIVSLGNHGVDAVSSSLDDLTGAGAGQVFFEFYTSAEGSEPYASDGTPAGTQALGDLYPGSGGSNPVPFGGLGDGRALFAAHTPTSGTEPWISDGTPGGTLRLRDIYTGTNSAAPEAFTPVTGGAAFFADDGVLGDELWFTDGTPGGTVFVRDIYTGADGSFGGDFGRLGNLLLFGADDGVHGEELWASDGTAAGTLRLTDLSANGYEDLYPADFVTAGNRVFFIGYDEDGNDSLYVSNGLTATLVIDPDDTGLSDFHDLLAGATGVYFADDQSGQDNIWWSDGYTYTQRSTFAASDEPVTLQDAVTVGDRLFLRYCDLVNGCELWTATPTSAASLLADIYPGLQSSDPTDLTVVGDELVFAAADPTGGREVWMSDGTEAGTQRLADIQPGLAHSNPEQFAVSGHLLYFVAYTDAVGLELWAMSLAQKLFLPLINR